MEFSFTFSSWRTEASRSFPVSRALFILACFSSISVAAQSNAAAQFRSLRTREIRDDRGKLLRTETFYVKFFVIEVKHGPTIRWHDNGRKKSEVEYRDGKRHGKYTEWDTLGNRIQEGWYAHDIIVGKRRYWSIMTGSMIIEEFFDANGHLVELTWFYENGNKKKHGKFKPNRQKHGVWTYWNQGGQVVAEGEWKDGQPWEGVCGVPALGDAGSLGGIEVFGRYHEGKLIAKVPRPTFYPPPKEAKGPWPRRDW